MAENINLRENEYQSIVSQLADMHENHLQNVLEIIIKMKLFVNDKDVFSTNLTSKKISDMLEALTTDVMSLLQQAFNDSEAGVANMIQSTMSTDTVCS